MRFDFLLEPWACLAIQRLIGCYSARWPRRNLYTMDARIVSFREMIGRMGLKKVRAENGGQKTQSKPSATTYRKGHSKSVHRPTPVRHCHARALLRYVGAVALRRLKAKTRKLSFLLVTNEGHPGGNYHTTIAPENLSQQYITDSDEVFLQQHYLSFGRLGKRCGLCAQSQSRCATTGTYAQLSSTFFTLCQVDSPSCNTTTNQQR